MNGSARHVLVLGGTAEGRELAARLHDRPDVVVISSLAGRVVRPLLPAGEVRVGGFGGADGLAEYLAREHIDAVIDATHPFAPAISANAALAAAAREIPLLVLRRPPWRKREGDRWQRVPDLATAAERVAAGDRRVLLTVGRRGVAAFADGEPFYLIRSIDPPDGPLPARHELLLARGPFALEAERRLLRERRIDALVTKNSGGDATYAKIAAARELGIEVVVVDRPPPPAATAMAEDVERALAWLAQTAVTR